jgi:hypothetical protein
MQAPALYKALALFRDLIEAKALTANYRALALAPDHVRAVGLFGQMRVEIGLGLDREVCVNAEDFLQVLRSLPDTEFTAEVADGALRWTCGPAKGHLALMDGLTIPSPSFAGPLPEETVAAAFGDGLELGALACGSTDLRALGLLGVQIRTHDGEGARAYSTDNITVAACNLGPAINPPGIITLLPDAVALLAAVIKRDDDALLAYDASSVYCVTANAQLLLHQVPPLSHDLSETTAKYDKTGIAVPLFRGAVQAFLRRAEALSNADAIVEISVEAGRMGLVFQEAAASSEEYYIVQGSPEVNVPPVRIAARRLAKILKHADRLVFDYAPNNVLVLRGPSGFVFIITGRLG